MPIVRTTLNIEEIGSGEVVSLNISKSTVESVYLDYQLVTGTSNEQVPQNWTTGIVTPYMVLIQSDQDVSWRLSAADTLVPIKAGGFAVLFMTAITNLLLTNSSGYTANIKVWMAGL